MGNSFGNFLYACAPAVKRKRARGKDSHHIPSVAAAFDDPYEDVVEAKERFDLKRWGIGTAIRRGSIRDCGWMTSNPSVIL